MTNRNGFDSGSDGENSINAEDYAFFRKRAKFLGNLSSFANVDLSAEVKKGTDKATKKDKRTNPAGLDDLEAAEDAQATILRKMQNKLQKKRASHNEISDSDLEESEEDEFDRRAKKMTVKKALEDDESTSNTLTTGLPIKTATGEWKRQAVKAAPTNSKKASKEEIVEPVEDKVAETDSNGSETTAIPGFEEGKETLALLAMEITENIDENVGKLREALKYTRMGGVIKGSRDEEIEMMRIGLITALAVFKDILPDYSIRPLTEAERQSRVSKEVKKQRHFEETILNTYRQYVERLEEILKTVRKGDAAVLAISVGCLSELAAFAGHFNYYERVLAALCGQVFSGKEEISLIAVKGVGNVFANDEFGRSTSHALRLLSDSVQARDYLPEVRCLDVLDFVRMKILAFSRSDQLPSDKRIASEEAARLDVYRKKANHLSKAQKKALKSELAESIKQARSEAEFSREERAKWSSDALKFLFRILFGILKRFTREDNDKIGQAGVALLPVVLKCLARCSQFLSVEYFNDLLSTLRKTIYLIEKQPEQSLTATLHTVQTVLQIAHLQETSKVDILQVKKNSAASSAALMDFKFYFDLIYRQIPSIPRHWSRDFESLLESVLSKLFLSKKHCPAVRVAAFIHRFANLLKSSSSLPVPGKMYVLRLILRLIERHEKARGLLDEETLGVAAYLPNCADPDLCNPFCLQLKLDDIIQQLPFKMTNDMQTIYKRIKT